ncbi:Ethanolamine-phosphate cytidylyltransferase [Seminavis robusta]|uniref:Ethanolamine-phosphate cytidylyltransferase n=1 Tax=Seminavis robusta TaxID=568900 RepID=A0A9N8E1C5_9STRA|nr:Ethanolamine-phosphate cytidylyltransferase [Seminavis robusta]|eukprot:Sro549_g164530.1 Ethanolamine-phosphate cytidylyltransferase (425) ;mRNA; f:11818-13175
MKFGKTLCDRTLKEWRFYTVDYEALKRALGENDSNSDVQLSTTCVDRAEFFRILDDSEQKLTKFYQEKERWAFDYMKTLEDRVTALREVAASPESLLSPTQPGGLPSSPASSNNSLSDNSLEDEPATPASEPTILNLETTITQLVGSNEGLKDSYRKMGESKHFHKYIYAKKSLTTFHRELALLLEFLELNKTAFSKILKKFDKKCRTSIREERLAKLAETHSFLEGDVLRELKDEVAFMVEEVNSLKPSLPNGWENRKVYTIGCFDLFHRGHQNVLLSLREFGCYIVAGIHDDESYIKLKNKPTIDKLETRMNNVKPYVDQIYVIPSTDPLTYIKSMVSDQDIASGGCCYARGDDMLKFPGRDWVESAMPVHFVPRTEACSSTLLRTIYHAQDESLRAKAAFAKTRYDGKPVDEQGNVLKLNQ